MCMGSPSMPPPAPVKEPDPAPKRVDPGVQQARNDERRRLATAAGMGSLNRTSPLGVLSPVNVNPKRLLGA